MINLENLISKQVLNLYLGKIDGTIKDAHFDEKYQKITSLTLFDDDEEEYTFPSSKIYAIADFVVLRNSNYLVNNINQIAPATNNPIGKKIYSTKGQDLGTLCDIVLNKNLSVKEFVSEKTTFLPAQIVNVSSAIVVNLTNKKVALARFKPKVKLQNIDNKVKIMTIEGVDNMQAIPQKFVGPTIYN